MSSVRVHLSAMMFLQFFVWGAWYVTAPNYLSTIGFQADDWGVTYMVGPIAGMISPFFVGMIADRFFAAQRILGVLHLAGAAIMYGATLLMQSSSASADPDPNLINLVLFAYMLTYVPTLALTNTLAMKNIADPRQEFPAIRVLGTIGWIVAGLTLSLFDLETGIGMFRLAALSAALLGVYSFSLPDTPPVSRGRVSVRQILGLDALVLLKNRSYLSFLIASTLICIPLAFYYQIASRIVEMTGMPIGLTMSYGQMSEIVFMILMPFFLARLGVKWMLAVGMLAWVIRYGLFSLGAPGEVHWMIITGIVLHGICYDFFFVTGQIYTDQVATQPIRAQAQALLVLATLGIGMGVGAQVAGFVETSHTTPESLEYKNPIKDKNAEIERLQTQLEETPSPDAKADLQKQLEAATKQRTELRQSELRAIEWRPLWAKPAIFAGMILLLFCLLFHEKDRAGRLSGVG